MMFNLKIFKKILFLLIIIYYSQGVLITTGSILSQIILIIIFGISFIFLVKIYLEKLNNIYINIWSCFLILNLVGYIFFPASFSVDSFDSLKSIIINYILFYPFFYLSFKKIILRKDLFVFLIFTLPILILKFQVISTSLIEARGNVENVVNNQAYDFVWLIPFVLLFRKYKIFSFVLLSIVFYYIIIGAKRGALICGLFGILYFVFTEIKHSYIKKKKRDLFLILIAVITLSIYGFNFYLENDFLIERISKLEEGGSGRDTIYTDLFNLWLNSDSILNLLFGYGFAASKAYLGISAHNDWLELLSNFGLVGIVLYFINFFYLLNFCFDGNKKKYVELNQILILVILIWFIVSLISMGYTNTSNGYLRTIVLAYLLATIKKNKL